MDFQPVDGDLRVNRYELAASQTIEVGDPVTLNSSGLVEIAGAASAALLGVAASPCTSSTANDVILVYDGLDTVFKCRCDASGEAVQAIVGDIVDLVVTSNVFYANLGASAVDVLKVVDIGVNRDPKLNAAYVFVKIHTHSLAPA
uniref:Putative structural protein n=1 Tax=viral metagenome TaxID=1070528 RepID=A0A6M3IDS3_9ZZZZ